MSFKADAQIIMEGSLVEDSIIELIWSIIPENRRDTDTVIQSEANAYHALKDAITDRLDALESIENANGTIDRAYNHPRGIA